MRSALIWPSFGFVAPVGRHGVAQLHTIAADANDKRLPEVARACVTALGFETGYNWQAASNWLLGLEADFSFSGMSGRASGTSLFGTGIPTNLTQSTTAEQSTDWYGTVAGGRAGSQHQTCCYSVRGFAYGRVDGSANYILNGGGFGAGNGVVSFVCTKWRDVLRRKFVCDKDRVGCGWRCRMAA